MWSKTQVCHWIFDSLIFAVGKQHSEHIRSSFFY